MHKCLMNMVECDARCLMLDFSESKGGKLKMNSDFCCLCIYMTQVLITDDDDGHSHDWKNPL